MAISGQNEFFASKGRYQHEEGGSREVKVGQEGADNPEMKPGIDEKVSVCAAWRDSGGWGVRGGVLQCSDRGSANSYYPSALRRCAVDSVGNLIRDNVRFRVQLVFCDGFRVDGLERAQADVERNFGNLDAAALDLFQDLRGEMQTRGRRCDRASFMRVDRLIAIAIVKAIGASDVGWKRHMSESLD